MFFAAPGAEERPTGAPAGVGECFWPGECRGSAAEEPVGEPSPPACRRGCCEQRDGSRQFGSADPLEAPAVDVGDDTADAAVKEDLYVARRSVFPLSVTVW